MSVYTEPPLTIAALESIPDDGNRYELIEGELYVSTSPSFFHQIIVGNLHFAFREFLRKAPVGTAVQGVGVIFDDFNGVIPDLVYFSNERGARILKGERFSGAPEIVVEILSPGSSNENRDRVVKRSLYSKRGVDEYWIIDPEARVVEVHRKRREGGLEFMATLQESDDLTSPLLPGFRTQVATLFER
jgi:Uma2 family endonuclease